MTDVLSSSYYKALAFYLQEQPTLLTDLLSVMISRIDHARVVRMFRQMDHIPLERAKTVVRADPSLSKREIMRTVVAQTDRQMRPRSALRRCVQSSLSLLASLLAPSLPSSTSATCRLRMAGLGTPRQ